jgi:hypothetical protein
MRSLSPENLKGRKFIGRIVDNNDPEKEGRCRVMVYGLFENEEPIYDDKGDPTGGTTKVEIPVDNLPWAQPINRKMFGGGKGGFADISIPKIDTFVQVQFSEGDIYGIEYTSIQNINTAVQADISESYLNSHVLAYDEDEELKVFYTPSKGIEIFLKQSHILINPDASITIEHADSDSIIELVGTNINITANSSVNITANSLIKAESSEVAMNGTSVTKLGPAPSYSAVLAEPLWAFLKSLATGLDGKLPATPGVFSSQAASFETLSTSKNVKLSS